MNTVQLNSKQDYASLSEDMVRTYLRTIGRIPLLTHEQEIVYGKRVQRMMPLLAEKEKLEQQLGLEPTYLEWAAAVSLSPEELTQTLQKGQ